MRLASTLAAALAALPADGSEQRRAALQQREEEYEELRDEANNQLLAKKEVGRAGRDRQRFGCWRYRRHDGSDSRHDRHR